MCMYLVVEVKCGMLYYDGEPSLGRLLCKSIAIPVKWRAVYISLIRRSVESPRETSTRCKA